MLNSQSVACRSIVVVTFGTHNFYRSLNFCIDSSWIIVKTIFYNDYHYMMITFAERHCEYIMINNTLAEDHCFERVKGTHSYVKI